MELFVKVSSFNKAGKTADKNGKLNVFLTGLRGAVVPEKARVISGTVAESAGLTIGKTQLIEIIRGEDQIVDGTKYERYNYIVIDANAGAEMTKHALMSQRQEQAVAAVHAAIVG